MEDNRIFSQELEEMRSQVAILKNKLAQQTIISDSHIRNSMKSKMSDMTKTIAWTIFGGIVAVPYCIGVFYKFGFSLTFLIATAIMLVVCIGLTIKQRYTLKGLDFSQGNLVDVAEKLNKVKKHYHEWIKVALPMFLLWLAWLAYEAVKHMEHGSLLTGFLSGAAVGAIIGGFIGLRINRKIVRKSSEILDQIKELG